MANGLFPQHEQLAVVNAIRARYTTSLVKMTKALVPFTPFLTAADLALQECDFVGYAPVTFTATGLAYADSAGGISFDFQNAFFMATSSLTPNDVYNIWIENGAGDLQLYLQLASPIPMQVAFAALSLDMILNTYGPRGLVAVINGVPQ